MSFEESKELESLENIEQHQSVHHRKKKIAKGNSCITSGQAAKINSLLEEKQDWQDEKQELIHKSSLDKEYIQQLEHTIEDEGLLIAQLKAEIIKLR